MSPAARRPDPHRDDAWRRVSCNRPAGTPLRGPIDREGAGTKARAPVLERARETRRLA